MKIRPTAILDFYDIWYADRARHVSGITGLVGEALGTALVIHRLKQEGFAAALVPGTPTTGKKKSPWLDCWITAEKGIERRIYQVEIKNWSAYSKGGEDLPLDASDDAYSGYAKRKWQSIFHGAEIRDEAVAKVTLKMRVPSGYENWTHRSLACFWFCLHPHGSRTELFAVPIDGDFAELEVFSMSAYLRSLDQEDIEVEMPVISDRMGLLKELIG